MAITNSQQARQMYKEGDFVMQGGVKNYLGKQTVGRHTMWQKLPYKCIV